MSKIIASENLADLRRIHDRLQSFNLLKTGKNTSSCVYENPHGAKAFLLAGGNREGGGIVYYFYTVPETGKREVFIELLFLEESVRGTGGGALLVDAVKEAAVKEGAEAVEVTTASYQAPGFYLKRGFSIVEETPSPVPNFPENKRYRLRMKLV